MNPEKEKAAAEEMRRQATAKLSETKKRKASLEDTDADDNISLTFKTENTKTLTYNFDPLTV